MNEGNFSDPEKRKEERTLEVLKRNEKETRAELQRLEVLRKDKNGQISPEKLKNERGLVFVLEEQLERIRRQILDEEEKARRQTP